MNRSGRGINLIIILLLAAMVLFWFSGTLRRMENTCTQAEFEQLLAEDEVTAALIVQNREVPTGSVRIQLKNGEERTLNVTDVNAALTVLEESGIAPMVQDVPGENVFMTSILPALIMVGGVFFIFMMMNAQNAQRRAAGGPSRHRQDAAGEGHRGRGQRSFLLHFRIGFRGDVRGRGRFQGEGPV